MSLPLRTGITLPVPPDPAACLATASWAEEQGYDGVWFADTGDGDALTLAAAVALQTQRVRIGTAIIPVYTRTPAVLACTAATLSHLAPERFVLGLGASSHAMIEGWHGLPFEKPLTRVRETTQIVRSLLDGEKSAFSGDLLRSQGYTLSPKPQGRVPLYLAALRGKMLELAGELGDGVIVNLFPLPALPQMLRHVQQGAQAAGRDAAALEVVCRFQVMVTDGSADARTAARQAFRQRFAPYYATPVYNRFLAWCGYEDVAATIRQGWAERDRAKTTGALEDGLIDEIAIIGSADECRERVRAYMAAGVTTAVVSGFAGTAEASRAVYEAFAPAAFPL